MNRAAHHRQRTERLARTHGARGPDVVRDHFADRAEDPV